MNKLDFDGRLLEGKNVEKKSVISRLKWILMILKMNTSTLLQKSVITIRKNHFIHMIKIAIKI